MRKTLILLVAVLALGTWAAAQTYGQAATGSNGQQTLTITHGPVVEQVTSNSAIVAWTTNVPSSAVLHYGTAANSLSQTAEEAWGGQRNSNQTDTHRVTIQNLQPNTTYYIQAESGQGLNTGTGQRSQIVTIHTTAQGAPPVSYPNGR